MTEGEVQIFNDVHGIATVEVRESRAAGSPSVDIYVRDQGEIALAELSPQEARALASRLWQAAFNSERL